MAERPTRSGGTGGARGGRSGGDRDRRPEAPSALVRTRSMADVAMASAAQLVEAGPAAPREPQKDAQGRSYATGARKNAVARVWVKPGKGKFMINGRDGDVYFARPVLRMLIRQPFQIANRSEQFDVFATVAGGGLSGQAGAVRHGISKALTLFEPELRSSLKKVGFLTRDSRVVERKKYGRMKARRSFQFSKR